MLKEHWNKAYAIEASFGLLQYGFKTLRLSKIVSSLNAELFDYLHCVGAQFPKPDPEYDAALDQAYLKEVEEKRLPQLEEQRLRFLSKDFQPGNNWWGSEVEKPCLYRSELRTHICLYVIRNTHRASRCNG